MSHQDNRSGGGPPGTASYPGTGQYRAEDDFGFAPTHDAHAQQDPLIGTQVGNFRVDRLLGKGAMGAVYLGVHPTLNRQVAIKVLQPMVAENKTLVQRFVDEARAVSSLGHPGLIEVYDFGTLPHGQFYSVMEYLHGRDLEAALHEEKKISPDRVAAIAVQIAAAASVAHDKGIVHRDLKPANVFLVREEDGTDRVKILDFGIAKLLSADGSGDMGRTQAGHIVGTPEYMSPEQAVANHKVDNRADIYALGCVLYELLCGHPPFMADNIPALLVMHQSHHAAPIDELAKLPPGFGDVVMRCLEKNPSARFQSMRELADSLLPFAATLPVAPGHKTYPPGASIRIPAGAKSSGSGKKLAFVAIGLVAVLGGVAIALMATQGGQRATGGALAATETDAGSSETAAADAGAAAPDEKQIAAGAAVWKSKCAGCHGEQGEGDGKRTPAGLEPKAFADAHVVGGLLDKYRFEIIQRGVHDPDDGDKWLMPAFEGKLSDDEIWAVVAFIRTLAAPAPTEKELVLAQPKPKLNAKLAKKGKLLFHLKCESCHGPKGGGKGRAAEYLKRKPADLAGGVYKLRSTDKDSLPTDMDIFRTLTAGMGVGGMPSFGKLSENERWALVAFVKSLSKRFKKGKPGEPLVIPSPPPLDAARIARGEKLYKAANCVTCHGETGRGDGPDADTLTDDHKRKIRPPDFAAPFVFIGGSSPRAVYRTMMTGIAGTPMPEGTYFFDADQAWDVVAYILSLK